MASAPRPHILLVDDDLAVLRVLDRALTRLGARVSVAADRETARSIVSADDVDALVLDYRLPGVRGTTLLLELAAASPRLRHRAVFMTGDISTEADEAIRATSCPCLHKPFPMGALESLVRNLFENDARGPLLRAQRTAADPAPLVETNAVIPAV